MRSLKIVDARTIAVHSAYRMGRHGGGLPGELNHVESFTFMGYSGSIHKHDNMLTFIGNGSAESFENTGDMTDLAVMINHDNNRSPDIYRMLHHRNAAVVMIYTGVETPPSARFRSLMPMAVNTLMH